MADGGPFKNFANERSALGPGVTALIALDDGRVIVARVLRARKRAVLVHTWGMPSPQWIDRETIKRACLVPCHTAHDRLEAARRIRRSGTVLGASWPRESRGDAGHLAIDQAKLAAAMERIGVRSNAYGPLARKRRA